MISFIRSFKINNIYLITFIILFLNIVYIFLWNQFSQFQEFYIISHYLFIIFNYLISFIRFLVITHIYPISFIRLFLIIIYIYLETQISQFQNFYICIQHFFPVFTNLISFIISLFINHIYLIYFIIFFLNIIYLFWNTMLPL